MCSGADVKKLKYETGAKEKDGLSLSSQSLVGFESSSIQPTTLIPSALTSSHSSQLSTSIIHRSYTNPTNTRCWLNATIQAIQNCLDYKKEAYSAMISDFGKYLSQCQDPRIYNDTQDAINILSSNIGYKTLRNGHQDCRKVFKVLRDGNYPDITRYFAFTKAVTRTVSSPCAHTTILHHMDEVMFETGTQMADGQNFIEYVQHCLTGVKKVYPSYRCVACFPTRANAVAANALGSTTITKYWNGSPPFFAISNKVMTHTNVPPIRIDPTQTLTIRYISLP